MNWLQKPIKSYEKRTQFDLLDLELVMEPGDILLVEGNQRVSSAIKYLTQSTWSHAAFYLGNNNKKMVLKNESNHLVFFLHID